MGGVRPCGVCKLALRYIHISTSQPMSDHIRIAQDLRHHLMSPSEVNAWMDCLRGYCGVSSCFPEVDRVFVLEGTVLWVLI